MKKPDRYLVLGLPKSATTGLYSDLVKALSPNVVSIFEPIDNRYISGNEKIQRAINDGKNLVVKLVCVDHDPEKSNIIRVPRPDYDSFSGYEKKIFLVRDPRDNLVSYMLYMIVNSRRLVLRVHATKLVDLIREKEDRPGDVSVRRILSLMGQLNSSDFVELFMRWRNFSVEYLDRNPSFYTFRYEDYIYRKLASLEEYLGFRLRDRSDVPDHFKFVARTRKSGDWRNWFLEEDVEYFRPYFRPYMEKYGYPDDWELPVAPVLDPEKGSGYVAMLVEDFYKKFPKYGQTL